MQHTQAAQAVRRVVTGHDSQGISRITQDAPSPFILRPSGALGPLVTDLWRTSATPADNTDPDEPCGPVQLAPPANGSVLRIVEFPPDAQYMENWDEQAAFAAMGHELSAAPRPPGETAGMHRTRSLDYAIVLSGEIWAVMDEGETLLRTGDVLIQRGTRHGWSNRTAQPARLAFVLIDAQPRAGQA